MMNTKRSTVLWAAALVVGLGTATAQQSMTIGVWDDQGNPLTSGSVHATSLDGGSKGVLQPDGTWLLPSFGTPTSYGMKSSIVVDDLAWGTSEHDVMLSGGNRIDIVYTAFGVSDVLAAELISPDPITPSDGGPSNDTCENAQAVGVPSTTLGSTLGATDDPNAPFCGTSITAPGVWYTVEGTGTTMSATLCNLETNYDTKINVYCGECDDLDCVTGNDDNFDCAINTLFSRAEWCSQAGATYYVLVQGFGGQTGDFGVAISADAIPCVDPIECIPPDPLGACCFSDGSCLLLTEADCGGQGGDYQGDFTDCFDSGDSTSYTSNPGTFIPDADPVGIDDTISVGDNFLLVDVDVDLTITHTWQGDLAVTLTRGGDSAQLIDRPGVPALSAFGCSADNYAGVVIDDTGTDGDIEDACAPDLTGSFTGVDSLAAAFGGTLSQGDWVLNVSDNATGDTGNLDSWTLILRAAGAGICPGPECFLVIGPDAGTSTFVGANHEFEVQISDVEDSYIVLMEDIPEFTLPNFTNGRGGNNGGLMLGQQGGEPTLFQGPDSPQWMLDGQFNVQVLMWNPGVFPALPEQFSVGLAVELMPNGRVKTTQYGEGVGTIDIWAEVTRNADGTRTIKFPFFVDMP